MKKSKQHIFKIQRPLMSTGNNPPYMLYNESRSITRYIPADMIDDIWPGNEVKIYVRGHIDDKGKLHIDKRVKNQSW